MGDERTGVAKLETIVKLRRLVFATDTIFAKMFLVFSVSGMLSVVAIIIVVIFVVAIFVVVIFIVVIFVVAIFIVAIFSVVLVMIPVVVPVSGRPVYPEGY